MINGAALSMFFMYLNRTTSKQYGKKNISVDFVSIEKKALKNIKVKKSKPNAKDKAVLTLKKKEPLKSAEVKKKNIIKPRHHKFAFLKQVQSKKIHKKTAAKNFLKSKEHKSERITHKTAIRFKVLKKVQGAALKETKDNKAFFKTPVKDAEPSKTNNKYKKSKANNFRVVNISNRSYANIFMWINKHKFYPTEALYKEDEGKIGLSFTINSNGKIANINVKNPSQYNVLNAAAVAIVKNSSPIPKRFLEAVSNFPLRARINIVFKIE